MAAGITITDKAAEKIRLLIAAEKKPDQGLRVKVVGGGCSGLHYKLDFDDPKPGDRVISIEIRNASGSDGAGRGTVQSVSLLIMRV